MKNLYKAIADFKQECPIILKETAGHNYNYADLPSIDEVIKPLLKKNGLNVMQPLSHIIVGDKLVPSIKTIIVHVESGEVMEDNHPLPETLLVKVDYVKVDRNLNKVETEKYVVAGFEQMSQPQAQGSIITYYRRYCLSSFLGLITDKDTDASGSGNKEVDGFGL